MSTPRPLTLSLFSLCLSLTLPLDSAISAPARTPAPDAERIQLIDASRTGFRSSNRTETSLLRAAATDTFYLYGGPDEPAEGKFQDATGVLPDRQGWIGVDRTDEPNYWRVSTFNAENLNDNGPGNLAAWCGRTAAEEPGWVDAPGYGNSWDMSLLWERTVADPTVGQTVDLDFYFNFDLEVGWDFLYVEYETPAGWVDVADFTNSSEDVNGDFLPPGERYSEQGAAAIEYLPSQYAGVNGDEIRLRLRIFSDGAWSNADGFWFGPGAAQIDDIAVTWSGGNHLEDFESGDFDFASWHPQKNPFAGDFSRVWTNFEDIDPCRSNSTPVMGFVDGGQVVNNAASAAWIPGYPVQTSGTTSLDWDYGVPDRWVVNYHGGLSGEVAGVEEIPLANDVWSPPIEWDLPGPEDDGVDVVGAGFRFDVWAHLPFSNSIYYQWDVRSSVDGGVTWRWDGHSSVYFYSHPAWLPFDYDVSDLIQRAVTHVQIRFAVVDWSYLTGIPSDDATPSPFFDNVAFYKYQVGGAQITTRTIDLAQDGFPTEDTLDVSSAAARDLLDVPFDMARDVAPAEPGVGIVSGDSIIADVTPVIPFTALDDVRMVWVLEKNPFFEDAIRSVPARATDENVDSSDPLRWTGEVVGRPSTTASGAIIQDRYFFDLPDEDFLYPGDRLRYYLRATDSDARVTTLPTDTAGFTDGVGYDPAFVVRALPSLRDPAGDQPPLLVVNDFGHGAGENELHGALGQLGLIEGDSYDLYTVAGASYGVSNGIGASAGHGATASQLAGYGTILVLHDDLTTSLLSDGSQDEPNDKGDDLGVLTAWNAQAADRTLIHFGDNLTSAVAGAGAAGASYVQNVLGVGLVDDDVRDALDGQNAPRVQPLLPAFFGEFVAYGGCLQINRFDEITPVGAAVAGHGFVDPQGAVYPGPAASVIHDRTESGFRKLAVTLPFGLRFVRSPVGKAPTQISARAALLGELLDLAGLGSLGGTPTDVAPGSRAVALRVWPNPFNPQTRIELRHLPDDAEGSVRIYNLRGELVRTLVDGELDGETLVWNGRDGRGASVASGVYVVEARGRGFEERRKIALVR